MQILVAVFLLQALVLALVLWFLRGVLERELWAVASEGVAHAGGSAVREEVRSVVVVVPGDVPSGRMSAFVELLRRSFTGADLSVRVDASLLAGVQVQAGDRLLDYSLSGRLACLRGTAERVPCP